MVYVCECPSCGLVVRTENPAQGKACACTEQPTVTEENPDGSAGG
jgi:hypothetical protein